MQEYKNCSVRILSRTNKKQSVFTASGKLCVTSSGVRHTYQQQQSFVTIETLGTDTVRMERQGDLYLRLCFFQGRKTQGDIGLSSDTKGEVSVYTEKSEVFYTENGEKIKIILEYVLQFSSQEEQRTSLQLVAECKN